MFAVRTTRLILYTTILVANECTLCKISELFLRSFRGVELFHPYFSPTFRWACVSRIKAFDGGAFSVTFKLIMCFSFVLVPVWFPLFNLPTWTFARIIWTSNINISDIWESFVLEVEWIVVWGTFSPVRSIWMNVNSFRLWWEKYCLQVKNWCSNMLKIFVFSSFEISVERGGL